MARALAVVWWEALLAAVRSEVVPGGCWYDTADGDSDKRSAQFDALVFGEDEDASLVTIASELREVEGLE